MVLAICRQLLPNSSGHYLSFYQGLVSDDVSEHVFVAASRGLESRQHLQVFAGSPLTISERLLLRDVLSRDLEPASATILEINPSEVLFYDGSTADLILAMRLADRFPEIEFFFNFHNASFWGIESPSPIQALRDRSIGNILKSRQLNLSLFAESLELAQLLRKKFATEIAEFPVPSSILRGSSDARTRPFDLRGQTVAISVSGTTPNEWLGEYLTQLSEKSSKPIQVVVLNGPPLKVELERLSVESFSNPLPFAAYVNFIQNSKVHVLAYQGNDFYRLGSSGRFEDTLLLGAVPLVPGETAMAKRFASESALSRIESFSPDGLASLTLKILADKEVGLPAPREVSAVMERLREHSFSQKSDGDKRDPHPRNRLFLRTLQIYIYDFFAQPVDRLKHEVAFFLSLTAGLLNSSRFQRRSTHY